MAENLPFWFSEEQVAKLQAAGGNWFSLLRSWASWPLAQMDPENCEESVLGLLAWQRDIDRFSGEGLDLFRKRIKYAYANARDAGSAAGFKRIFERLGVGEIEQEERMPGRDWDIVAILLSDEQLSGNQPLLDVIIRQYGRTCRRYEWKVVTPVAVNVRAFGFGNRQTTDVATWPTTARQIDDTLRIGLRCADYGFMQTTEHGAVPPVRIRLALHGFGNEHTTESTSL